MKRAWISRLILAEVALAGVALLPAMRQDQSVGVQQPASDPIAEARARLAEAETKHPGNTEEVARALLLVVQRECVGRRITPETLEMAQRAIAVSEAARGKDSLLYALALANLAKFHLDENHPEQGRPLAEQALEIARRAGPGTNDLAMVADALDKVCFALADLRCALSAAGQAVDAERASHDTDELYLASFLQDLAQIQVQLKDWPAAQAAVEQSLQIVDRQTKPARATAILESNAGMFFSMTKKYDAAHLHLNKALELSRTLYGSDSVQVAHALMSVGYLDAIAGHDKGAIAEYGEARALYSKWYGPEHSRTAILEASFARALVSSGDLSGALEMAVHSHRAQREYFSLAVRVLPERQALALASEEKRGLNVGLSIVVQHPELGAATVYEEEIRSRALVAEEMARRQVALNRKNDAETDRLLAELAKERSAAFASSGGGQGESNGQTYSDAMVQMERTERALAERSLAFRTDQRSRTVQLSDVRGHLPAHSVLISYVAYDQFPLKFNPDEPGKRLHYMAFLAHPDSSRIAVVDLGQQAEVDALVKRCRAAAEAQAHSGGLGTVRNERAYRQAGLALRKRVWDPLQAEIGNAKLALVVPDGDLNLIPFASLPYGTGYLVEHGPVIHLLSSERDVVPDEDGPRKNGLLAIGSPSFDIAGNSLPASPLRDAPIACEEFRKLEFHSLPGSAAEVSDINLTWRRWNRSEAASLITGAEATRSRFLTEASHNRVLHIATHAFVLDQRCGGGNPLLHSGLVFAGANQSGESSILTAQEIASLDLSGVEWAVLSACNTGNGDLQDGEGVLGLERAFRVAGAHSVVMALWPVDDDVTRHYMHELYVERLGRRTSTADAVWNASRKLLLERRAAGKSTHPWYWAGFVGSGSWD